MVKNEEWNKWPAASDLHQNELVPRRSIVKRFKYNIIIIYPQHIVCRRQKYTEFRAIIIATLSYHLISLVHFFRFSFPSHMLQLFNHYKMLMTRTGAMYLFIHIDCDQRILVLFIYVHSFVWHYKYKLIMIICAIPIYIYIHRYLFIHLTEGNII